MRNGRPPKRVFICRFGELGVGVRQVENGMSKRILVVEDQPDNRQIIRDMLAPPTTKSQRRKTVSRRWGQSQSSGPISS